MFFPLKKFFFHSNISLFRENVSFFKQKMFSSVNKMLFPVEISFEDREEALLNHRKNELEQPI